MPRRSGRSSAPGRFTKTYFAGTTINVNEAWLVASVGSGQGAPWPLFHSSDLLRAKTP